MKKLQVNPCVKCGEEDARIACVVRQAMGCDAKDEKILVKMIATCTRCGWQWNVTPLDEVRND